jgi:hypothetical protein
MITAVIASDGGNLMQLTRIYPLVAELPNLGSINRKLRESTRVSRLRLVESRLSLAFTMCQTAESDLSYGGVTQARKLIHVVQRTGRLIREHLDQEQVPSDRIAKVGKRLLQLEKQLLAIQARCRRLDK